MKHSLPRNLSSYHRDFHSDVHFEKIIINCIAFESAIFVYYLVSSKCLPSAVLLLEITENKTKNTPMPVGLFSLLRQVETK